MKIYARVKEDLRFGRNCQWEEVKKEIRQLNHSRLVFVNGEIKDTFVYDVVYVFEK